MNKTIKINISGIVFQIEEDAFEILRDYLNAVNNRLKDLQGGSETIDDIESRIAEIFQSEKGVAGPIAKENVIAMINIIGKTEEFENAGGPAGTPEPSGPNYGTGSFGNEINEMFRAIGRCFVIFFRIILIVIGVVFVITGFLALLSFVLVFFFKYPGIIQTDSFNSDLFFLPDFLKYFLSPSVTLWVIGLLTVSTALPLLAIIYWGIKMIFQFRAKEGVLSLVLLLVWIGSLLTLSLILFSQGISFAETGKSSENNIIQTPSDTLYIEADKRISSLHYDNELSIPGENYRLLMNKTTNELFIKPEIRIEKSDGNIANIELIKSSHGRTRSEAIQKAQNLVYNYRLSGDTVYVDEYYIVPSGNKWAGADVSMNIMLPAGTVVCFDSSSESLFSNLNTDDNNTWYPGNEYWLITDDGVREAKE
jgi:hypothetical protein